MDKTLARRAPQAIRQTRAKRPDATRAKDDNFKYMAMSIPDRFPAGQAHFVANSLDEAESFPGAPGRKSRFPALAERLAKVGAGGTATVCSGGTCANQKNACTPQTCSSRYNKRHALNFKAWRVAFTGVPTGIRTPVLTVKG